MAYVDGFVLPLPKKNLAAYRRLAQLAARVWLDHGALEYRECVGEDLAPAMGLPFTKLAKTRPGETVVFAWVLYRSRAHRDRVNAKVMKDPRLAASCHSASLPFDCERMAYGGFEVLVGVTAGAAKPRRPTRSRKTARAARPVAASS